jgi:hypothetical protein
MIISRSARYAVNCFVTFLLLASLTVSPSPSRAQGAPCLVMLKDGDIWMWCDGSADITQLTQYGHHRRPVMSPDGTHIAFNSIAPETVAALSSAMSPLDISRDDWPSNMWIMRLDQTQPEQIAVQLPEIAFTSDNLPMNAISRSNPTWSPDGQSIAWTEIVFGATTTSTNDLMYRLVIYNIASKTTQVIMPDLPKPFQKDDTLRTIRVLWGTGGLALVMSRRIPAISRELYVFDPSGQQTAFVALEDTYYDFMWVNDNGKDYIGIMYATKAWVLIDPLSGQSQPMNGTPEMYSTQADNYATFITIKMNGAQIAGLQWQAAEKAVSKVAPLDFHGETNFAHRITVSPNGIAYVSDAVYIWREGNLIRLKNTDNIARGWEDAEAGALAWGSTAWRVRR